MAFADPVRNVARFGLREGMKVADLGAGSGAYALEMAKRVGDTGRVYAVDVQKDLLSRLYSEAKAERLTTIEVLPGDLDTPHGSGLGDGSMDFVLVSNILFQAEDGAAVARETYRVLRSGGSAAVIDWSDSFGGLGPRPENIVSREKAARMFIDAGFSDERAFDAGEHHWGVFFKKQ
ncbi:MAG: methyltransferase domain-containing protein [Candidatus Vogelbacteria bacterium]|nr:methyltransferase domain-containing protein [Candidatus Vogelbacteria bacterium]